MGAQQLLKYLLFKSSFILCHENDFTFIKIFLFNQLTHFITEVC